MSLMSFIAQYIVFVILGLLTLYCSLRVFMNDAYKKFKKLYPNESEEDLKKRVYKELKGNHKYYFPDNFLYVQSIAIFIPILNIIIVFLSFFICLLKSLESELVLNAKNKIDHIFERFYNLVIDKLIKL